MKIQEKKTVGGGGAGGANDENLNNTEGLRKEGLIEYSR